MLDIPFASYWWFFPVLVWVYAWKGLALWHSARHKDMWWFVAFLFLNTLGVLEILYLYVFAEKKPDLKFPWKNRVFAHKTSDQPVSEQFKEEVKDDVSAA